MVQTRTTDQFVDEVVDSLSRLDQQDDPPGRLQLGHHVLQRLGANHLGALRLILQEVVHLGHGSVVSADLLERLREALSEIKGGIHFKKWDTESSESSSYHEAVVIHVHDEVLAHDGQANQCNVCSAGRRDHVQSDTSINKVP